MSRLRGALRRRQAAAPGRTRGCRGPGSTHAAGTVRYLGRGAGWTAGTACYGAPELPAGCEDGSASMASALLLFAYRHSALLRRRKNRTLLRKRLGDDALGAEPAYLLYRAIPWVAAAAAARWSRALGAIAE